MSAEHHLLNLDSIATMGKFPKFCVDTYLWGDRFFNGYDTTYVAGSGYKFNVKLTSDNWTEGYRFNMPDKMRLYMRATPSSSIGIYLTYLAVSVGYDVNISKLTGSLERARKRLRFGFNCSLLSVELYHINNNVGAHIKEYEYDGNLMYCNIPVKGIDNSTFGLDIYYFFNHKRYSEAAAFNFSRLQKKSQGSFYAGFSFYHQNLNFDFQTHQSLTIENIPNLSYHADTKNFGLRLGYGYNWCFAPHWLLAVSESPVIGLRKGYVNSDISKYSLSLYNHLKLSIVWNSGRWFSGLIFKLDNSIISDNHTVYSSGLGSLEAVIGMRFNLW